MNAIIVRDMASLRAHLSQWQDLYESVQSASLFTSPSWVLNWLQSFLSPNALHCVLVYDNDKLQAVLPLVRVATRWRRVPVVALCPCTNAHSVRSAWLFLPAAKEAIVEAALKELYQSGGWDVLLLDGCAGHTSGTALPPILGEEPIQHWNHSCLHIQGSWSEYFKSRSRDLRRNLRRTEEGLRTLGQLDFTVITNEPDQLMRHWVTIDRASWKAQTGELVDSNSQTQTYYRNMLKQFAKQGQLLAGVLWLNGNPIATVVCAHDKGVCHTLKTAMREDLSGARLSTGALVMAYVLEFLWNLPYVRCVDFVSKQSYTNRWTIDNLDFERHLLFAPTWRGRLVRFIETLLRWRNTPMPIANSPTNG